MFYIYRCKENENQMVIRKTSLIKQKINEELNNITIVAFASVLNAQEMRYDCRHPP
ncbi:hypothetical protein EfmJHP9_09890 [Enterococcus faecium]|nr:hypothetical protein EfmJHP9_09890 [Enterococcus faecium]